MARKLTNQQQKFLDVLFEEAGGDLVKAKQMAGYSPTTSTTVVVNAIAEEVYEATKKFLARSGTKAAWAVSSLVDTPTTPGAKEKLAAAKDILDRANFKPSDKVEITTDTPMFILPEKKDE